MPELREPPRQAGDAHRVSVAYLIPLTEQDTSSDVAHLSSRLLYRKWPLLIGVLVALAVAIVYLMLAQRVYRVHATLEPVREPGTRSGAANALLGEDVGALLGGNTADRTNVAMSLVNSDEFLMSFIEQRHLLPQLFPRNQIATMLHLSSAPSTSWRGAERFRGQVLELVENKKTGLVEISVVWPDPVYGAGMLTALVESVNERLRERQIRELQRSIDYLKTQLAAATNVEVRQAISKVLESRLSEASLVGTREDFALKFVARPAITPRGEFASPRPVRVLILATTVGLILGLLVSFGLFLRDEKRATVNVK
jgi:uncharacterized protein involved in exopolysaccharide biosynthesis